ncbi:hypothetical protein [Paracoccus sp. ME4]|uniref:hypothetical protein n=1 Tax=Paracoccus sp. ME4 TaxID=3138066 RepID=UPI00398A7872
MSDTAALQALDKQIEEAITRLDALRARRAELVAATIAAHPETDLAGRLRAKILSTAPEQMAWLDTGSLLRMLDIDHAHEEALVEAATRLETGETPLLQRFWFLGGGEDTIEIPDEDIVMWQSGEGLAHPETGEEITNPERVVNFAWMALPRS